jgi:DHA2 family multidrug resistance protein-like MFS transporter
MESDKRETAGPARAGRREWVGLGVLSIACLVYVIDLTVLHLAVPKLSADLQPTSSQLLWIIDIYGFVVAGSLITMGTLGDRIGRRRLLLIGAAAFGLVSLLAAFSTSAGMLIASRALMGVAGATLAPSTLSLIFNMFQDPKQRSIAIGWWIAAFSAGSAIGPLAGGVMLEHFWWGSVFLLALPVMGLLLVLGPKVLPEYRDPEAGRLDLRSAAMSLASVLAVILGLKEIAQDGVGWPPVLTIIAGLVLGALFARRQGKLEDPLIDLRLFRIRALSASLVAYFLSIFVVVGYFLFVAQYLQLVLGLSPLVAGLWSLPSAAGFTLGSTVGPRILSRFRPARVMAGGLVLSAAGMAILMGVTASSGLAVVLAGSIIISLGLAPVITLATELIVGSAPPEKAGAASGISETGGELGGALGLAILGSIGTAVYRSQLGQRLPAGVPAGAAEVARDTLGGAVGVAAELPDGLGTELVEVARLAFTDGLRLTAAISAVLSIVVAIIASILLRSVPPQSETIANNTAAAADLNGGKISDDPIPAHD